MLSKRLTAVFGYKELGETPKILYFGFDADEALAVLESNRDKRFFEIRVCRNIDAAWMHRYKSEPVATH